VSTIHIYTTNHQPATRFVDRNSGKPFWTRMNPRRLLWCNACRQRRWAKYLTVQVYYDQILFWCRKGHGCKR